MLTRYLLPVVALGLLIFAVVQVTNARKTPTSTPPLVEPARTPFARTVAGAGMVEPQTENISIGSPVPGLVAEVFVGVGRKVEVGTELFRLDDRVLQAELKFREAALATAQAEVARLENRPRPEELPVALARVEEAEADLSDELDQLTRTRELVERRVRTDEELVRRQQAFRAAEARLSRAKAELELLQSGTWEYDLEVARRAVDQAEAQVAQVRAELDRLTVCARVAGEVLQVHVHPGEYVGAPSADDLIVLGNVEQLHVRVNIDEHDIPRFQPGSPARAMLRGQGDVEFPLSFVRVEPFVVPKRSLTGDNTERVDTRVLQVIYALDTQGNRVYVGQQLDVFIDGSEQVANG